MNKIYTFFLLILMGFGVHAQDAQFSVFTTSPLVINPATTGYFKNDCWRVVVNHRNQWSSFLTRAIQTSYVSFDMPIASKKIGVGAVVFNNSATKGSMSDLTAMASFSYNITLNQRAGQYLTFGAQAGIKQRSFKPADLQFGNQYVPGSGYDPNASNGESFAKTSYITPDFNFGAIWFVKDPWKQFKPWISVATLHILEPKKAFDELTNIKDARIPRKYQIYGGADYTINKEVQATPVFTYSVQGNSAQLSAGAIGRYTFYKEKTGRAVEAGAFLRTEDAIVTMVGFETQGFAFIFNYEINTSSLKTASKGIGGFEVTIRYVKQCNETNVKFGY